MASRSLNDRLLSSYNRPGSGGLPFQGYGGGGWTGGAMYSSWGSWDAALDRRMYGQGSSKVDWGARLGDPSFSSLVMALYRFLASTLPSPPLQVMKRSGGRSGKKGEAEPIEDHPLTQLWNHPNGSYSGSTLRKGLAFSWATRSEAYIIKTLNRVGEPLELWYEPPFSIRPVWPIDGSEFVAHYEVNRMGSWIPIPKEQVIHLRDGLNPYNQRVGLDTTVSVLPELVGDQESAYYYASLMGGSGVPPFLVGIDPQVQMTPQEVAAFQKRLVGMTTGDRKGEPVVVKGGRAYKLGFTPRELNFEEARIVPEDRFCAVRGIPAVVLELGAGRKNSTYHNVAEAEGRAWKDFVLPLLTHLSEELDTHLLSDFEETDENGRVTSGAFCQHDTSNIPAMQEDEDSKATRWEGLVTTGIAMRREARSAMKLPPTNPDVEGIDDLLWNATSGTWFKPGEENPPPPPEQLPGGAVPPQLQSGAGADDTEDPTANDEESVTKSIFKRLQIARRHRAPRALLGSGNGQG